MVRSETVKITSAPGPDHLDFEFEQIEMTQYRAGMNQEWTWTESGSGPELDNKRL